MCQLPELIIQAMLRRPELKIIAMSYTNDTPDIIQHFTLPIPEPEPRRIVLKGRPLTVETIFSLDENLRSRHGIRSFLYEALTTGPFPHCDVLIFTADLQGSHETYDDLECMKRDYKGLLDAFDIYVVTGSRFRDQSLTVYQERYERNGQRRRKIIITSDLASTGMTFPHLGYVIDSVWHKKLLYRPEVGHAERAMTVWSKGQIVQRHNRAAQTSMGIAISLATQAHVKYPDDKDPPIKITDFSPYLLYIMATCGDMHGIRLPSSMLRTYSHIYSMTHS